MGFVAATTVFGVANGNAASAAELAAVLKAPPAAVTLPGWTGFYVGGFLGGARSDVDWAKVSFIGDQSLSFDPSAAVGGIHTGLNYQIGPVVLGVEGAWGWSHASQTVYGAGNLVTLTTEIEGVRTLVGRIGYAWDRWMIYVSGGHASARVTTDTRALFGLPGHFRTERTEGGHTFGGGLEFMLMPNVIAAVDYKYIDLGRATRSGVTDAPFLIPVTITGIDTRLQVVTGRLSYKFDWPR